MGTAGVGGAIGALTTLAALKALEAGNAGIMVQNLLAGAAGGADMTNLVGELMKKSAAGENLDLTDAAEMFVKDLAEHYDASSGGTGNLTEAIENTIGDLTSWLGGEDQEEGGGGGGAGGEGTNETTSGIGEIFGDLSSTITGEANDTDAGAEGVGEESTTTFGEDILGTINDITSVITGGEDNGTQEVDPEVSTDSSGIMGDLFGDITSVIPGGKDVSMTDDGEDNILDDGNSGGNILDVIGDLTSAITGEKDDTEPGEGDDGGGGGGGLGSIFEDPMGSIFGRGKGRGGKAPSKRPGGLLGRRKKRDVASPEMSDLTKTLRFVEVPDGESDSCDPFVQRIWTLSKRLSATISHIVDIIEKFERRP